MGQGPLRAGEEDGGGGLFEDTPPHCVCLRGNRTPSRINADSLDAE